MKFNTDLPAKSTDTEKCAGGKTPHGSSALRRVYPKGAARLSCAPCLDLPKMLSVKIRIPCEILDLGKRL